MPQPPLPLNKYLSTVLPPVKENFPAGGGATGAREDFDTKLKGVSYVEDFEGKVDAFISSLPTQPIPADPTHPYPHFLTVIPGLPKEVKSAQDVQQYIKNLPLSATSSTLSALSAHLLGLSYPSANASAAAKLDAAGYESDGGEAPKEVAGAGSGEVVDHAHDDEGDATKSGSKGREEEGVNWGWRFSKSPLGSGEFLLIDEKSPDKVHLVVRTINTSAFSDVDWKEFVFEGQYHYNTKSKPSWYHSRIYRACKRLGCRYFVFTDYQKWLFGVFSEDQEHVNITQILPYNSKAPTILQALVYWTRSATAAKEDSNLYKVNVKDVSGLEAPYEKVGEGETTVGKGTGRARKVGGVSQGAESDIEE